MTTPASDIALRRQRQVIFWRLLAAAFGLTEPARNVEQLNDAVVDQLGMPKLITDPNLAVDTLLQRYPELKPDFDSLKQFGNPEGEDPDGAEEDRPAPAPDAAEDAPLQPADLRRALAY